MTTEPDLAGVRTAPRTRPPVGLHRYQTGTRAKIRILHSVGHLLRGGIEHWLYEVVRRLDPECFEHHVMVWTDAEEAFTAEFRAAGALVLPCLNHANPLLFARNLGRLLAAHGPYDVLHTHGTHYHGYVMLLARLHGIPARVAHSHNDISSVLRAAGLPYRAYAAAGHAGIRNLATAGLAVSDLAAASMFGPAWRSDPRWRRLFCGIDLEPFTQAPDPGLRETLGIPAGRFVVGHVGRFERAKNHAFILDVAAALIARRPEAHFLLLGEGGLRDGFVAELERRGLTPHFTLIRYTRSLEAQMIGAMDAFIFPSLHEGLALSAVMAQAAGLPCLFSDAVSPEVVVNPALVRILPLPDGAAAWAEAILDMPHRIDSRDPDLRRLFSESDFNLAGAMTSLAAFYRDVAAPHGR